jgi:hypothetical protein
VPGATHCAAGATSGRAAIAVTLNVATAIPTSVGVPPSGPVR